MRWRWTCRDYTRWIEMWGRTGGTRWSERACSRIWIQGVGNMGCFGNPIIVSGSVLYNILYCIVELFSLIRRRRHGWSKNVKPHVSYVWLFYLYVLELTLLASKFSLTLQLVSEPRLRFEWEQWQRKQERHME